MERKQAKRIVSWSALAAAIAGLGIGQMLLQNSAEAQRNMVQGPVFEVDPFWPKPIPGLLGNAIGVWADEQDHIWITHRGADSPHNNEKGAQLTPPIAECCKAAPPV